MCAPLLTCDLHDHEAKSLNNIHNDAQKRQLNLSVYVFNLPENNNRKGMAEKNKDQPSASDAASLL